MIARRPGNHRLRAFRSCIAYWIARLRGRCHGGRWGTTLYACVAFLA